MIKKTLCVLLSIALAVFFVWFPIEVRDTGLFNSWLMWVFWVIFAVILILVPIKFGFSSKKRL